MAADQATVPIPPTSPVSGATKDIPPASGGMPPHFSPPPAAASPPAGAKPPLNPLQSFLKKRRVFLLLPGLLLIFLLLFFLFRSRSQPSKKVVTLDYWGLWEPDGVIQGAIAAFEKEHPQIKVRYHFSDPEDYQARLENSLAHNQGPDIFRLHLTWLPVFLPSLAPLPTPEAEKLGLEKNYFAVIKRSLKINGRYWAIPLMVDNLALYYNRQLLGAANLKPPRTWWGFEEAAKKLTSRDANKRIHIAGAALGTTANVDHWSDIVGLMLYQNGVDLNHPEKTKKNLAEALEFYTLFSRRDHLWNDTLPNSTVAFAGGKLAFYFAPSWRVFNLEEMNPKLRFAIAPVPKLPKNVAGVDMATAEAKGELNQINWATFWVEGVNKHSRHQREAWLFLEYLASKKGLERLYQAASQIRAFGEIYPRRDLAQGLTANPLLRPFVNQADNSYSWYLASFTHGSDPNEAMIKYFADAINALNQGNDSQTVITTLIAGINQVKARYHLP